MRRLLLFSLVVIPLSCIGQGHHKDGVIIGPTGDTIGQLEILNDTTLRLFVNADTFDLLDAESLTYIVGGTPSFKGLTDTPGSYVGEGENFLRINIGETGVEFVLESSIDHDGLTNYVASEHIDWSINGPDNINANRIDDTQIDHDVLINSHNLTTDIDHDQLTNYDANEHIDHTTVYIGTSNTSGLGGGWTIDQSRNLFLSLSRLNVTATVSDPDQFGVYVDGTGQRKITYQNLLSELALDLDIEAMMESAIPGITDIDSIVANDEFLRFYYPGRYYDVYPPVVGDTTNWYFSMTGGDDDNDGHSVETPKKTFPHLLTLDLDPGDTVFFNKGDTWRLTSDGDMSWRGEEDNHITFTSYGNGNDPRIWGSDTTTAWTDEGSNVWSSNSTFAGSFNPGGGGDNDNIWFRETDGSISWGSYESGGTGSLNAEYEFYYNAGTDILYVYSTSDPSSAYTSIEVPVIANMIELQCRYDSAEYYTFDGLEIAFCDDIGIRNDWPGGIDGQSRQVRGVEVRNCYIHHIGDGINDGDGAGTHLNYSDVIIEDNIFDNIGRRGISLNNDAGQNQDTIYNYLVQDNTFSNGFHTSGPDFGNLGPAGCVYDSIVVRRNIIDDTDTDADGNFSNGIYFDIDGSNSIKTMNVWVYNNLHTNVNRAGIQFTISNASGTFEDIYVHNNTLYGFHSGVSDRGLLQVDITSGTYTNALFRNNILFTNLAGAYAIHAPDGGTGITMDYNLVYTDQGATEDFLYFNGTDYNTNEWSNYKTATSWESNSPDPADPQFKDAPDSLMVYSTSDAVDGGVAIAGYTTDYEGTAVGSPPNIGAYERTEPGGWVYDPTNWYWDVEGNDANSGHHPDSAKQTISELNSTVFSAGDTIYFDGGDIFRGQIDNPEDGSSGNHLVFTISPYGSSTKPIITTAINESSTGDWFEYSTNLWSNDDASFSGVDQNVGNLIFTAFTDSIGRNESNPANVTSQGDFYFYEAGDSLIMYSNGNPATVYGDIECAINTVIFNGDASDYITIDNLALKWGGRHGIGWNTSSANNITIEDCDIMYIGGCNNYDGAGQQLGNGIEFYSGDYTDITIHRNRFYQIFDAAITPQYPDAGEDINNFYVHGNLMLQVRYAFEFAWDTDGEAHTVHFNNNTCYRDENYVFRPDMRWESGWQGAFVTFYDAQDASNTDVDIYNNIFYYEEISGIYSAGVRLNFFPWPAHIDVDYNLYYSPDAFGGDHCLGNYSGTEYYDLATWQSNSGQDSNGYNSDPDFYNTTTFRVGSGSDAVDGGVAVGEYTLDFESVAVGSPPNVGAVETTQD